MTSIIAPSQRKNLIEQMFDDIFRDFPVAYVRSSYEGFPISNVLVNKKTGDLRIEVALTGYKPENIEVSLGNQVLIIRGKADTEEIEDFMYVHQKIRERSTFERRFAIPKEINTEGIKVKNQNGLLVIDLPFDKKITSEKVLKIE
jgi:HSP20 family molecular chaperone IbpA